MISILVDTLLFLVVIITAIYYGKSVNHIGRLAALLAAIATYYGSDFYQGINVGDIQSLVQESDIPMYYMNMQ